MLPTDLTVCAVVERNEKFLIVEERSSNVVVITQPGGHIEAGESPEDAVVREAMEETGCVVSVSGLLGVYLWIHPQTRQQFLRIAYTADLVTENQKSKLDNGIHAVHWYTVADIKHRKRDCRSPVVLRCIDDYVSGKRQPATLLAGISPVQKNVGAVLAHACLV
ncbi:MAG: NUDIX domain-containing protein [Gammaproteobacteria bacterium]|nr:NUDIX domain-containing protein [Gammaproteobacteria bacterium]MDH4313728.1 NUDIX domain-containing protein [Gammaproteobacteria bacterium]MDH5212972.1 NUDIX domain-containing protein [Gammaproteobacteria bacterium]